MSDYPEFGAFSAHIDHAEKIATIFNDKRTKSMNVCYTELEVAITSNEEFGMSDEGFRICERKFKNSRRTTFKAHTLYIHGYNDIVELMLLPEDYDEDDMIDKIIASIFVVQAHM